MDCAQANNSSGCWEDSMTVWPHVNSYSPLHSPRRAAPTDISLQGHTHQHLIAGPPREGDSGSSKSSGSSGNSGNSGRFMALINSTYSCKKDAYLNNKVISEKKRNEMTLLIQIACRPRRLDRQPPNLSPPLLHCAHLTPVTPNAQL
jgi:hypothetical protein